MWLKKCASLEVGHVRSVAYTCRSLICLGREIRTPPGLVSGAGGLRRYGRRQRHDERIQSPRPAGRRPHPRAQRHRM